MSKSNIVSNIVTEPSSGIVPVTVNTPATRVATHVPMVIGMTPKRATPRKQPKEPATLMAFAIEQGGRIELTDANKQELASRGLPSHRISNAAYGIRKCFGNTVTAERTGRLVTAYTVTEPAQY